MSYLLAMTVAAVYLLTVPEMDIETQSGGKQMTARGQMQMLWRDYTSGPC